LSNYLNFPRFRRVKTKWKRMPKPKMGQGVIVGKNVVFGENVVVWNYVVIGDNTKIGDETRIGSFCDIGKNVVLGKNCNIQTHVTISNGCTVGDNVFIAPNSTLLNDKFPVSECLTPPVVEDDAVIGGCVAILPNVKVGKGAVVAAGSVVTKDVPHGTVVKDVPAKPMMTRKEYEAKRKIFVEKHLR
jgi:acetyltransferase-like isoleucine patch superfamily enzyme